MLHVFNDCGNSLYTTYTHIHACHNCVAQPLLLLLLLPRLFVACWHFFATVAVARNTYNNICKSMCSTTFTYMLPHVATYFHAKFSKIKTRAFAIRMCRPFRLTV